MMGGNMLSKVLASDSALEVVDIDCSGLTLNGYHLIFDSLKYNTTLKQFRIKWGFIDSEAILFLGKVLAVNTKLQKCFLDVNLHMVVDLVSEEFAQLLKENKSLDTLRVPAGCNSKLIRQIIDSSSESQNVLVLEPIKPSRYPWSGHLNIPVAADQSCLEGSTLIFKELLLPYVFHHHYKQHLL